jgi:hypothetical protein
LTAAFCNRRTKTGARDSVKLAIKAAATPEKANYVRSHWLPTLKIWGNYAREHLALLLQVITTNLNKTFYRSLKVLAKISKLTIRPKYTLAGIIDIISQYAKQYDITCSKSRIRLVTEKA